MRVRSLLPTAFPVRQLIHHIREPRPIDPLSLLPLPAKPKQRPTPENQRPNLFSVRIDFQVQRRARLGEFFNVQVGAD